MSVNERRAGDVTIASASPERFLRVSRDGVCESRPIKGTARRATKVDPMIALREA